MSLLAIGILSLQTLCGLYGLYLLIGCIRGLLHERTGQEIHRRSL